ncbi:MAG: UDP-N-acetylmuramate dehydrogenase [Candidatus Omnitrophica bacterium]|nr:UDP-N-acetylmuramate dehydrogenase [Candidatus Omnitrophota bacterium]
MNWQKSSLKKLTTFKIGGKIDHFVEPRDESELRDALLFAKCKRKKVFVIGAGSNILAPDRGLSGVIIRLKAADFSKISVKGNVIECGSGVYLNRFLSAAKNSGLTGAEFLVGIPGMIGGALIMNAGGWGKGIGGLVKDIRIMDYNGRVKIIKKSIAGFSYRNSKLNRYIILGARFILKKGKKSAISATIKKYLDYRRKSQDNSLPNVGCIFKNPAQGSAGMFIDACGLKGKRCAGAVVSERHANFILNARGAKAKDVLKLIDLVSHKVKEEFGIKLEPEIRIWK